MHQVDLVTSIQTKQNDIIFQTWRDSPYHWLGPLLQPIFFFGNGIRLMFGWIACLCYVSFNSPSTKTWVWQNNLFLSQLETIICRKHLNVEKMATMFYKSGNHICCTLFSIQFLELIKPGFGEKNHVSTSIRSHYMAKTLKYGKTGNPVVKIWQPCRLYNILNVSIQFL